MATAFSICMGSGAYPAVAGSGYSTLKTRGHGGVQPGIWVSEDNRIYALFAPLKSPNMAHDHGSKVNFTGWRPARLQADSMYKINRIFSRMMQTVRDVHE
jgi:hypothetical protein